MRPRWLSFTPVLTGLFLFLAVPPAHAQRGALTAPLNLAELTDGASVIVQGRVLTARVETHPELTNLYTVVVTLHVESVLKGEAGETFSFRQFIWDLRDRQDAAGYQRGLELLLLMNPPTELGLTSPRGLEQGRFRLVRDAAGNVLAVNGHGNAGLFRGLEAELKRRNVPVASAVATQVSKEDAGSLRAEDLRSLIRALVKAPK